MWHWYFSQTFQVQYVLNMLWLDLNDMFLWFRMSMHPFGVKVLCIEPGFFKTTVTDTDMILKNIKVLWERLPKETKDDYGLDYLSNGIFG